jgi:uncharacterized protein (DUF1330 family)
MPSETAVPAYFLALLRVPSVEAYRRDYGRKVLAQLAAAGATLLVGSATPTVLEGQWEAEWTVVIRFPDRAAALHWYESEAYAPLKKLRLQELTTGGAAALFDAYQPPAIGP